MVFQIHMQRDIVLHVPQVARSQTDQEGAASSVKTFQKIIWNLYILHCIFLRLYFLTFLYINLVYI